MTDPTTCAYAPPGEYIKDHTLVRKDGWFHLFSISGTAGYYHGYNGNEETISWSVSRNLVDWEFRGHVLHASQWPGFFDQHEVWAPFCFAGPDGFYLYYTGIIHPTRPLEYRRLGHSHPWVFAGHVETQGIARATDLTDWVKISDPQHGSGVPGRDAHVVYDEAQQRYLLYSCIGITSVHVSSSSDLVTWTPLGICAEIPLLHSSDQRVAGTTRVHEGNMNVAESPTVMRHPLTGRWILLLNYQYLISDDPCCFDGSQTRLYDITFADRSVDWGFACETVSHEGRWYRTGAIGRPDHWQLGLTEVAWDAEGAYHTVRPSILSA